MKVIVDRIEGNFAVCEKEDRSMINIPFESLSFIPSEGDVLIISDNGIVLDSVETAKRKKEIEDLTHGMWE